MCPTQYKAFDDTCSRKCKGDFGNIKYSHMKTLDARTLERRI